MDPMPHSKIFSNVVQQGRQIT